MLSPGTVAPDFTTQTSDGRALSLSEFRGKKNVVLYFYPKNFSPVCTRETCGFASMMRELGDAETTVIGVSTDDDASHEKFRAEHDLPFSLVCDRNLSIARAYEAAGLGSSLLGLKRLTYVIDKQGEIKAALSGLLDANKHVQGARDALAALSH